MKTKTILFAGALLWAGCTGSTRTTYLETVYTPDRATFGDQSIPPPPLAPERHIDIVNPDPTAKAGGTLPSEQDTAGGTWTFVTPPTVTRIESKANGTPEFTLFKGRPNPGDLPFLVISVNNTPAGLAETDQATYTRANARSYALNGNSAKEWTGKMKDGASFCELLIQRLGAKPGDDVCHAMAIAHSDDERKLAESVLASITWKPAGQ